MKLLTNVFNALAACMLVFSCAKPAELDVMTSELSFTKDGGTQSISFSTNKDWTASASESWVTVTSSGTSTSTSISVTAAANPDYDDRTATVTIKVEELTKTVSIKQSTNLGLMLDKTSFDLTDEAQCIEVEVKSNIDYEYVVDEACKDWIMESGATKALSSKKLTFDVAANTSYDSREGKVIFKEKSGSLTQTLTIRQSQKDALMVGSDNVTFAAEGETKSVKIESNVRFSASVSEDAASWLSITDTKGLSESTITLVASENASASSRSGKVTVTGAGLNKEITVTQEAGQISVEEKVTLAAGGETKSVKIESNVKFSTSVSENAASWLSITDTKGLSESTITIVASENQKASSRTGKIIVSSAGDIRKEITVTQEAGKISVKQAEYSVEAKGGEIKIDVSHNISYTAEIAADSKSWITFNESKSSDSELWYTVSENESLDPRTGHITIKNGELQATVTVTQAPKFVPVSKVTLDKKSIKLLIGNSKELSATVSPDNATDKTVVWESSNTAVATVADGVVRGIASGKAIITAKSGDQTATCEVTVISESELDLEKDVTIDFTGMSTGMTNGKFSYGRQFTIRNASPVDIELVEIGTTNFISIGKNLSAGESYSTWLNFSYNVYPKITVRFKYKNQDYEIYLDGYGG